MSFRPPKGTDDVLAPESQAWRRALRLWDELTTRYGYPPVMTPVVEATELFERGTGAGTEIVTKEMYTFTDRAGRSLTLRPEVTPGVVRAYLQAGMQGAWKGAYSGPCFRYEQPQAGRRRQFWQVGVEYLGAEGPTADAEVIELGYRYLEAVGVPHLELRVNSLGDPECRPAYVEELRSHLRSIAADLSADSAKLIDVNPLRVLDSKTDRPLLGDAPKPADRLCAACRRHHESVRRVLDGLGVPYTQDDSLVRGLDYYTRTAFEYVGRGLDAAQNAVGGGGRYDGLAEALGGRAVPGLGFALGVERMLLSLAEPVDPSLGAYLVSETGPEDAIAAVSLLRREGAAVDFDTEGRSVKAQFRAARRLGAPVILVWRGEGRLVDAQTEGERREMPLEEAPAWLKAR